MADLRPYVCTFRDCDLADEQYLSKGEWLRHEYLNHIPKFEVGQSRAGKKPDQPSELLLCPFCGEKTDRGEVARVKHLGRHMEEIAFAVVTKSYEDWDFYSDSSSRSQHAIDTYQPVGDRASGTHRDDFAGHLNGTTRAITGVAKVRRQSSFHEREPLQEPEGSNIVYEAAQHYNGSHAAPLDAFRRIQERDSRSSSTPQDLRYGQHEKIQDFYYGCTFPSCDLRFGTRPAWMIHELSTHLPGSAWRCSEHKCGKMFREKELFRWHLIYFHDIPKVGSCDSPYIARQLRNRRVGRDGQQRFWCGFCKQIIPSPCTDSSTRDFLGRFNHIDDEHFKKGQLPCDWCPMTPDNPFGYLELLDAYSSWDDASKDYHTKGW